MYKRITHNIIEEHFENYNEGSTKSFLGKSKVPTNEIFNKNTFNDNVSAYATNYAQDIISMINSLTGTEDDLIVPFEKLYTIVDNLGNLTKPFYSSELGERINIVLRSIPLLVFMSVNSMKLGRDPQLLLDRLDSNSIVLSNALSNFNLLWNNLEIQNILKS